MKIKQRAISLFRKTETGRKVMSNQCYHVTMSAVAFMFNLLYALYHCMLGIMNQSSWFLSLCAFYAILAIARFSAVLCECTHYEFSFYTTEIFLANFTGMLLVLLSSVLAVVNYISMSQDIVSRYEEIMMIMIATYTFYKFTKAIVKAVKQHKNPSLLLMTIRVISYAEASASMLTLQRSMLASFGSMNNRQIHYINTITGGCCMHYCFIARFIYNDEIKKERNLNNVKI